MDDRAGLNVEEEQGRGAGAAQITVGDDRGPLAGVELDDRRSAIGVTEVVGANAARLELPEDLGRGSGFRRRIRIGNVQRVEAFTAGAEAANQYRMPGGAEVDIARRQCAIDIVGRAIGIDRQSGKVADDHRGNIGEDLGAGVGIERVQHAVVRTDVDARTPGSLRDRVTQIAGVGVAVDRFLDVGRSGMDDRAQDAGARAVSYPLL